MKSQKKLELKKTKITQIENKNLDKVRGGVKKGNGGTYDGGGHFSDLCG